MRKLCTRFSTFSVFSSSLCFSVFLFVSFPLGPPTLSLTLLSSAVSLSLSFPPHDPQNAPFSAGRLSKAADVFAFGVLLWEMNQGKRPWAGLLQMQVIFAVTIRRRRLSFPAGAREAHPRFVALAEECMAPEAEKRPSFEKVLERLREVEGAPGYVAGPAPGSATAAATTDEEEA